MPHFSVLQVCEWEGGKNNEKCLGQKSPTVLVFIIQTMMALK